VGHYRCAAQGVNCVTSSTATRPERLNASTKLVVPKCWTLTCSRIWIRCARSRTSGCNATTRKDPTSRSATCRRAAIVKPSNAPRRLLLKCVLDGEGYGQPRTNSKDSAATRAREHLAACTPAHGRRSARLTARASRSLKRKRPQGGRCDVKSGGFASLFLISRANANRSSLYRIAQSHANECLIQNLFLKLNFPKNKQNHLRKGCCFVEIVAPKYQHLMHYPFRWKHHGSDCHQSSCYSQTRFQVCVQCANTM
jgi:hypothetical protein